jgi:phosphate starvation-inducible protein PhoH
MLEAYASDYESELYDNYTVERKRAKRQRKQAKQNSGLSKPRNIRPLTETQSLVFQEFEKGKHLMLHGCAGTGKTFLTSYLAIQEVMMGNQGYSNIQIIRSVVPTRDMGFLPGTQKEKSKVYEAPYNAIFTDLFGRGDAYDVLKSKRQVLFETTSFIRGMTFDDSIIIVDECQNLTFHELDSVITRIGENCRVIFCGDFTQSDFRWEDEKRGINEFMKIIKKMDAFSLIQFEREDIVRSDLVKEYICTKLDLGIE